MLQELLTKFNAAFDFLKIFGPTALVLGLLYYRGKARKLEKEKDFEKSHSKNADDVKKENAGLSADDIIDKYIGNGRGGTNH